MASVDWWRHIEDCDPISLEPLKELSYPPFVLFNDGDNPGRGQKYDGRLLANYIVSTGRFECVTTRRYACALFAYQYNLFNVFIKPTSRPFGRPECVALDEYLAEHDLGQGNCVAAWNEAAKSEGERENGNIRRAHSLVWVLIQNSCILMCSPHHVLWRGSLRAP